MDILPSGTVTEILKWIGLVFAAGFIGYFGRYLSMLIIERLRKRKAEQAPTATSNKEAASKMPASQDTPERDKLKLEKKRIKLAKKMTKKQ